MTVEQMLEEVYYAGGKPSDVDPYNASDVLDSSTAGYATMLRWLNLGYERIWSWKFRDGSMVRFPSAYATVNFKVNVYEDSAASGSSSGLVLPAGFSSADDYYKDWLVSLESGTGSGQKRYISDYVGATKGVEVSDDFTTSPDSGTYFLLTKRWVQFVGSTADDTANNIVLDPVDEFGTLLKVTDLEDEQILSRAERTENFAGNITQTGIPSSYYFYGNKIYFDVAPDESRWYQAEYYKKPTALISKSDEPDIPSEWHFAIVLYALWWSLKRQDSHPEAYATKRDLVDYMESTREAFAFQTERMNAYVEVIGPTD